MNGWFLPSLALWATFFCAALPAHGSNNPAADPGRVTEYASAGACAACHPRETRQWRGSHHRQSMQPADATTVLGAFDNGTFVQHGRVTRFFRRADAYFVETDGPGDRRGVFPVRYTFGVQPLQQYLLELPDSRLQALGIAWDSRPAGVGGQRWFHVYGDTRIDAGDVLHWTRLGQNWDSMCADCHSTGLVKRFDTATRRFATTWAEDNVACEACHGPGAPHVAWVVAGGADGDGSTHDPIVRFDERQGVRWIEQPNGNRRRNRPRTSQVEINTCAACHARRSRIDRAPLPGAEFLDGFRPALIEPPLYHVDGQIRDEVYVYGSFLQSRMYAQGVTCSDCHEPHGLTLRAPGARVCLQCHAAESFAVPAHHLHPAGSAGADCIACHMPVTTYMQVDARHDHAFGVPRPDLAARFGTPDACTNCHADRGAQWAADRLRERGRLHDTDHWRDRLATLFGVPSAARSALASLAADPAVPGIIRATAIVQAPASGDAALWSQLAGHEDPLIRWAAARALRSAPTSMILTHAPAMLADPVRAVRIAAADALAPVNRSLLPATARRVIDAVLDEALDAERVNGERAEAQTNIGNWERRRQRPEHAELAFRTALELNPLFVPAYVNLADLYRTQHKDAAGEALLREALALLPGQASLHYALGLLLLREERPDDARKELARAAAAVDATPRMALAHALLLEALGESEAALRSIDAARRRFGAEHELDTTRARLVRGLRQAAPAVPPAR